MHSSKPEESFSIQKRGDKYYLVESTADGVKEEEITAEEYHVLLRQLMFRRNRN